MCVQRAGLIGKGRPAIKLNITCKNIQTLRSFSIDNFVFRDPLLGLQPNVNITTGNRSTIQISPLVKIITNNYINIRL